MRRANPMPERVCSDPESTKARTLCSSRPIIVTVMAGRRIVRSVTALVRLTTSSVYGNIQETTARP
jgi:hypothetical protein